MKFAAIAVCVATVSAQEWDKEKSMDMGSREPGSQEVTINAGRMGGKYTVNTTDNFYAGNVKAMGDEYSWEYKRSGAVALLGSTLAFANAALYMA